MSNENDIQGNWIKWHRSMQSWEWRQSPKHYSVFGFCLERANYKENKYKGEIIPIGSFTTSLDAMSNATGVTIQSIRTILKNLKKTGELTYSSTPKRTMITITNWDGRQIGNKQLTNDQQTTNKRSTCIKNKRKKEVNNKRTNTHKSACVFIGQIEQIYANHYPRKVGKSRGIDKLSKQIKSDDDLNKLQLAVNNYSNHVKDSEMQYIKQFSTFASEWKDWIDFQPEKTDGIDWDNFEENYARDHALGLV